MNISHPLPNFDSFLPTLKPGQTQSIPAPAHPLLVALLKHQTEQAGPHLLVSSQKKLLWRIQEHLLFLEPAQKVFFLEEKFLKLYKDMLVPPQHERLKTLAKALKASTEDIFMATPEGLLERLPSPHTIKDKQMLLQKGHNLPANFPTLLQKAGYKSRERVEQIGEFSLRGAFVDLFCPLNGLLKLELIGHQIAQISYKAQTPVPQQSHPLTNTQKLNTVTIMPAWEDTQEKQNTASFLDYLPNPLVWSLEESDVQQGHLIQFSQYKKEQIGKNSPFTFEDLYFPADQINTKARTLLFTTGGAGIPIEPTQNTTIPTNTVIPAKDTKCPAGIPIKTGHKVTIKEKGWPQKIKQQRDGGMFVFISAGREKNIENIKNNLEQVGLTVFKEQSFFDMKSVQEKNSSIVHLIQSICFDDLIWPDKNLIFLKGDAFSAKTNPVLKGATQAKTLNFAEIKPGDLMVHRQYGIGCFRGLKMFNFGQSGENEFLMLEYRDKELVYVPVYALSQVQKYMAHAVHDGHKMLDKLGSARWLNTKQRVKNRIKNMSLELMNLYHRRANLKRKRFSATSLDFEKFEQEFAFIETADQKKAIQDILKDLTHKDTPADRLICGDTGFGKTEVAMRAIFKVIEDGYQVAFMSPTTLLSFQHFETFKNRFKNWPVQLGLLNRFTSPQKRKQLLKDVSEGRVDVLMGTHRILSRDIRLKKPGLLIIDEEHLFGVKSKEKIKNWHTHIDTLSLSATPIPRSFSMSLSGLRDMSLILTPPLNRKAVQTFISPFNKELIKNAVQKELDRKGQVIFIHNRISTIYEVEKKLQALMPFARIRVAHGKMKNLQEKIVLDFFQQKFDLLLCTTIVESGMDFTNAGTLFIDRAEQFGLSELHQLRGRVGRSEREAYCYMLVKEDKKITDKAIERLRIIQENNQPGAGIAIAQYDLNLRGAGDLMGREQSGFLQEVGYELYFEFLKECVADLKQVGQTLSPEPDLKLNYPAFIPKASIPHEKSRLVFYKKLAMAESEKEVDQIKLELEDFAGPLAPETENLILLSHCRWLCKKAHVRELRLSPPCLDIHLAESTPLSPEKIVSWVQQGVCQWHNQNTLKFSLPPSAADLTTILHLLKTLFL